MGDETVGAEGAAGRPVEEDLSGRLKAATRRAYALGRTSAALLVAARTTADQSARLVAHAVPDIGDLAATKGLTLCDLLAGDEVLVLPDLRWDEVAREQQCDVCAESVQALSGA